MFRDSHCYFSAMRLKSGGYGTPTAKSGGYAYPPYPPKVTPMAKSYSYSCSLTLIFHKVTKFRACLA